MDLRRGDVVIVRGPAEMGKPRPSIVVQSDLFKQRQTVIICPLSSAILVAPDVRPVITPTTSNGLLAPSQAMVERISTVNVSRVRRLIGRLNAIDMHEIDRALLLVLGLESSDRLDS